MTQPPEKLDFVPRMTEWRDSPFKRVTAALLMPLVYAVNRPTLAWFGRGFYDLALRFNGIAINFKGQHGLTLGEEKFLARQLDSGERGVLLDVGANVGSYAKQLRAVCPQARIFAFEPHPATFGQLAANIGQANIEAMNCALGAAAGRLSLYDFASGDGSTQASLSRDAVDLFSKDVVAHEVTVTTIDAFMEEQGIAEIAFLKIDTEGHDLDVLRGARAAIAAKSIRAIQFEFIPANVATRVFVRDFFEILPGYRLHRLCLNGALLPMPVYDVKRCEIFVTHNLVALPI